MVVFLFAINASIFQNKIRKINIKIAPYINRNVVSSGHAEFIANEMFHKYAQEKVDILKEGVAPPSVAVLDYVLKCMEYNKFLKNATFEFVSISLPDYQIVHRQNWEKEKNLLRQKYDLCGDMPCPEVFYFHHGLRFASKRIRDYVRHKDIIDCGAFIGDSFLVLREYTDKVVYCYEFSRKNVEKFSKVMKTNSVASGYRLIPMALGEDVHRIRYHEPDAATSGMVLIEGRGNDLADMTTIVAEVEKYGAKVGFIKMDVEGYGLPVIKGAINTIKSQRPVLSLGVYHNHDELFRIKPLLQKHLKNYVYEFHLQAFDDGDFNEMILFCYPKEVEDAGQNSMFRRH
ncbi:MAG: FkbM family methyltransferase [Holosporaceae bacterium]|nr:FkbM family methyltransferase [Holosporaceae bacterium]